MKKCLIVFAFFFLFSLNAMADQGTKYYYSDFNLNSTYGANWDFVAPGVGCLGTLSPYIATRDLILYQFSCYNQTCFVIVVDYPSYKPYTGYYINNYNGTIGANGTFNAPINLTDDSNGFAAFLFEGSTALGAKFQSGDVDWGTETSSSSFYYTVGSENTTTMDIDISREWLFDQYLDNLGYCHEDNSSTYSFSVNIKYKVVTLPSGSFYVVEDQDDIFTNKYFILPISYPGLVPEGDNSVFSTRLDGSNFRQSIIYNPNSNDPEYLFTDDWGL